MPSAELHLPDTGHFALKEDGEEIAQLIRAFLAKKRSRIHRKYAGRAQSKGLRLVSRALMNCGLFALLPFNPYPARSTSKFDRSMDATVPHVPAAPASKNRKHDP